MEAKIYSIETLYENVKSMEANVQNKKRRQCIWKLQICFHQRRAEPRTINGYQSYNSQSWVCSRIYLKTSSSLF